MSTPGKTGMGQLIQAHMETVEVQTIHIDKLERRIPALEGRPVRAVPAFAPERVFPKGNPNRRHWA